MDILVPPTHAHSSTWAAVPAGPEPPTELLRRWAASAPTGERAVDARGTIYSCELHRYLVAAQDELERVRRASVLDALAALFADMERNPAVAARRARDAADLLEQTSMAEQIMCAAERRVLYEVCKNIAWFFLTGAIYAWRSRKLNIRTVFETNEDLRSHLRDACLIEGHGYTTFAVADVTIQYLIGDKRDWYATHSTDTFISRAEIIAIVEDIRPHAAQHKLARQL
jgi:hypothetical protein